MPEPRDQLIGSGSGELSDVGSLDERMRRTPGLAAVVAEAEVTWRTRAAAAGTADDSDCSRPGWRTFEDAFPTFYEFTNRPR